MAAWKTMLGSTLMRRDWTVREPVSARLVSQLKCTLGGGGAFIDPSSISSDNLVPDLQR